MIFAQIENDKVKNIIKASQSFVDAQPGTYINVTSETPRPGKGWDYSGGTFAPPTNPRQMVLMVTSISSDDPNDIEVGTELTCAVNSTINVGVEIRSMADASLLPITDAYRLPVKGPEGIIYVLADFSAGTATITTTLTKSGLWKVTENEVNSSLSDPAIQFDMPSEITIYVLQ